MGQAEPDMAELFAPLRPAQAYDVVLSEARRVLAHVRQPVDAELWGSDMIGALSRAEVKPGGADITAELARSLVPAAEADGTEESLALLRILAAVGSPGLAAAAGEAAERVAATGVPDPDWAAAIGAPTVGECWHYSDIGGRQESVTVSFGYGAAQHALSVLIDHGNGGKIKDAWVADAAGLLDKTWLAAENDPLVVFERIGCDAARERLEQAVEAGEKPSKPDEAEDLAAHRAILQARIRYLGRPHPLSPGVTA